MIFSQSGKIARNLISFSKNGKQILGLLLHITPPPSLTLQYSPKIPKTLFSTMSSSSSASSWACSKCTFRNSSSQNSRCEICFTPQPQTSSSSPASKPKWSCTRCTFLNPYRNPACEICGTRASVCLRSALEIDDNEFRKSSIGSVFLPLRVCTSTSKEEGSVRPTGNQIATNGLRACSNKRKIREEEEDAAAAVVIDEPSQVQSLAGDVPMSSGSKTWKILSYNVWFRDDLEMLIRMNFIGHLIQLHKPDVICFQEVLPQFYEIFQRSSWWKGYHCSIKDVNSLPVGYFCMQLSKFPVKSYSRRPFRNSIMGRDLCVAEVEVQPGIPLVVATSHLESPCPSPPTWDQMFSKERVNQAKEAVTFLDKSPNAIFCGDMNWDDKLDGPFPISKEWLDAWTELKPGEDGWTYDTKANMMLSGNRKLQKRLDRFLCKLKELKVSGIEMIGTDAIPGASYIKQKKVKGEVKELELPVLPSDHFGLLLTISARDST